VTDGLTAGVPGHGARGLGRGVTGRTALSRCLSVTVWLAPRPMLCGLWMARTCPCVCLSVIRASVAWLCMTDAAFQMPSMHALHPWASIIEWACPP